MAFFKKNRSNYDGWYICLWSIKQNGQFDIEGVKYLSMHHQMPIF